MENIFGFDYGDKEDVTTDTTVVPPPDLEQNQEFQDLHQAEVVPEVAEEETTTSNALENVVANYGAFTASGVTIPFSTGEDSIPWWEQYEIDTKDMHARRTRLAEEAGGFYDKDDTVSEFILTKGDVKKGFALDETQKQKALSSSLRPMPDGSAREFEFLIDKDAKLSNFEMGLLMRVKNDEGEWTGFGKPTSGFTDWVSTLGPMIAVETGLSTASVATGLTAGMITTAALGSNPVTGWTAPVLSPLVAITTMYASGIVSEKIRNQFAEDLGLTDENKKNSFWRAVGALGDAAKLGFNQDATSQEIWSGRLEAAFGGIPVAKKVINQIVRKYSNNLANAMSGVGTETVKLQKRVGEERAQQGWQQELDLLLPERELTPTQKRIRDSIYKNAVVADEFAELHGLTHLLVPQITTDKKIQRFASLSEQTNAILPQKNREQMKSALGFLNDLSTGKIVPGVEDGGKFKEFTKNIDALQKVLTESPDLDTIGRSQAEMVLLFRHLRHIEAENLYKIAHDQIGSRQMVMTKILDKIRGYSTAKGPVAPTTERGAIDEQIGVINRLKAERDALSGKGSRKRRKEIDAEIEEIQRTLRTETSSARTPIVAEEAVPGWDDAELNAIVEQLRKLGKMSQPKKGELVGEVRLNRQQITAALKSFADDPNISKLLGPDRTITPDLLSKYDTPAKLLYLYASKLGQKISGDNAYMLLGKSKADGTLATGLNEKITYMQSLRSTILDTLETPLLEGADVAKSKEILAGIRSSLGKARKFYQETTTLTNKNLLLAHIDAATGNIQDELKKLPTLVLGGGTQEVGTLAKAADIPVRTLADMELIENYIRMTLSILDDTPLSQTDLALKHAATGTKITPTSKVELPGGARDIAMAPKDYLGIDNLKKAFVIKLGNELNALVSRDISKRGNINNIVKYLSSYSPAEAKILGLTEENKKLLLAQASTFAQVESTLTNIGAKSINVPFRKVISGVFKDADNIETELANMYTLLIQKGLKSQEKGVDNLRRGLLDYIFSTDSGVIKKIEKNSVYGEAGEFTIDAPTLQKVIMDIEDSPTALKIFDSFLPKEGKGAKGALLRNLRGISNYVNVIQSTGTDAGSALSGAQLIAGLYTLDPGQFISTLTRLAAQRRVSDLLVNERIAKNLLGKVDRVERSTLEEIRDMFTSKEGFIGSVLSKSVAELSEQDLIPGVNEQTDQALGAAQLGTNIFGFEP